MVDGDLEAQTTVYPVDLIHMMEAQKQDMGLSGKA